MFDLDGVTQARNDGGRRVPVLENVTLHLPAGQYVAVNGPAGAGRSALVKILAGLERPASGSVKLGGEDLAAMTDKRLAQVRAREIGVVRDPPDLRDALTLTENAEVSLARLGVAAVSRRPWAVAALAAVGLVDRSDRTPARLSKGDRQRVALARALAPEPRLLVVEEPTEDVMTLLERLRRERALTLVVTTRHERIAARAERVLTLHGGRLREGALARVA
ncbi:ABC transporter ATP-binding protein [Georgenia sp. AZ-5]|uniref:ABC transporter ATP-binding protein n=1 Tax=Georgenia sp. AZ-5 TaxID=3367526 RepID=UPI003753ED62